MNITYGPKEMANVTKARESFSGRMLTDPQFDEAMAITGIIEREINKTGKFKEKLGDYAYAFARSEKFDVMKAETIIRDLFKERTGMTMNQMREALVKREEALTDTQKRGAHIHAVEVGRMIEQGNKMPFHRAYAHQAKELAIELNITETGAKKLMKEEFKNIEGKELYETGKELEEKYYRPQIEAEKQQREEARDQTRSYTRAR
jgi:hypothetical protein